MSRKDRKFKGFFRPKLGDLQKKKKRSSPNFRAIFLPISQVQTFEGDSFRMGGLFSIFHRKSASKAQKTCVFAYFTGQWGGSSPPRPPLGYATGCSLAYCSPTYVKLNLSFCSLYHDKACGNAGQNRWPV